MKTRVISAIIAIIIIVPIIYIGGNLFNFTAALLGLIGLRELMSLKEKEKNIPIVMKIITVICFLALVLANLNTRSYEFLVDYKLISLIMFLILFPMVFIHDFKKYNTNDALYLLGGIFFLGIAFNYLITVRMLNLNYLIFLLLITIFTDTFAYITGALIGKHKMSKIVSPKKTWEGFIGGAFFGTFISSMFYISAFDYTGNIIILVLVILSLSVVAQVGDLTFSSIKRYYEIKDFGNIMPGHGGVLDRLDSILFVLLAFSFIYSYL